MAKRLVGGEILLKIEFYIFGLRKNYMGFMSHFFVLFKMELQGFEAILEPD